MADDEYILAEETPRTPVIREIPPEPSNLKRNITIAIWGIILVVLALFIGQNWRDVPLNVPVLGFHGQVVVRPVGGRFDRHPPWFLDLDLHATPKKE